MSIPFAPLTGLVLPGPFIFTAIFAQWLAPYPIDAVAGGVWEGPSATYWLGTDTIGRDILSRLIYGAQITIFVALAASVLSFSLGAFFGFLAAVKGGWIDQLLSRGVDLLQSLAATQAPTISLLGERAGSLGETSSLLIAAGGLLLLGLRIITWHIPFAMLATIALFA